MQKRLSVELLPYMALVFSSLFAITIVSIVNTDWIITIIAAVGHLSLAQIIKRVKVL